MRFNAIFFQIFVALTPIVVYEFLALCFYAFWGKNYYAIVRPYREVHKQRTFIYFIICFIHVLFILMTMSIISIFFRLHFEYTLLNDTIEELYQIIFRAGTMIVFLSIVAQTFLLPWRFVKYILFKFGVVTDIPVRLLHKPGGYWGYIVLLGGVFTYLSYYDIFTGVTCYIIIGSVK